MTRCSYSILMLLVLCPAVFIACKDPEQELTPPAVTIGDVANGTVPVYLPLIISTDSVSELGSTQARVYCSIRQPDVDAASLVQFGVYMRISSSQNEQAFPGIPMGDGLFRVDLVGLTPSVEYGVRAFGQLTGDSIIRGDELVFVTEALGACGGSTTMTDIQGNTYPVIGIAGRCWMARNLRTTLYEDSTEIDQVGYGPGWASDEDGACISYGGISGNTDTYGMLYNGEAVRRGVCPTGWSVPTDADWRELEDSLGMTNVFGTGLREDGQVGRQLKSITGWVSNELADNSSEFNALPGGMRNPDGTYSGLGEWGHFWSQTESSGEQFWTRSLQANTVGVYRDLRPVRSGLSVRCIKDL